MTTAYNAVKSTLKGAGSATGAFLRHGVAGYKGMATAGASAMRAGTGRGLAGKELGSYVGTQMRGAAKGFMGRTPGYSGAAMGTVGAAGVGAAGAAGVAGADFMNPWGLGWGD